MGKRKLLVKLRYLLYVGCAWSAVLLMGLFWLASLLSMSMAYSRLMQYVKSGALPTIPIVTEWALSARFWAGLVPLGWMILSCVIWQKTSDKQPESRAEFLLAFTAITLVSGFSMLVFFALGGLLPFLSLGASIK